MYAYRVEDCPFVLQNADWAGDVNDRRSCSGTTENIWWLGYSCFWFSLGDDWWQLRKKFMCSLLASERVCRISSPPKPPKYVLERTMRHHMSLHKSSQYYVRHKNRSCKYMEDMYCDSDYNNVILFTVINTFYTCQADVETKMTVGKYLCMTQRMEKCAQSELIHVSLVKKPHIVWVWSGSASTRRSLEMNRSVRRKRSDCVKEMQNNIYYNTDFSGWWLTKLLSCGCVLIRDRVNVW